MYKLPERMENGRLPAFAWPGGYPLVYRFADGGACCPDCANGDNGSDADRADLDPDCPDDLQWILIGAFVHWEGAPEHCSHCGAAIESAYGEPEND